MGKSEDWFGVADRERIALEILVGAKLHGGKVAAHCPFHVESTPGGAFFYDPAKDCGHCYSCGQASDLIGIYCALQGRPLDDTAGFTEFRDRFAPEQAGKHINPRRPLRAKPQPRGWTPEEKGVPPKRWREKAATFARECAEVLERTVSVQEQLAAWGIPMDVARACRLGWNVKDTFRPVTSWGLPFATGNGGLESKIWIPEGLVLPFASDGEVIKLRIRRPNPDTGPEWARGRRYHAVVGSSTRVSLYGDKSWPVWVLVESDRDAAMVWGVGRRLRVGAVGLASVSVRPDAEAAAVLRRAELILNSLDLDAAGAQHTHCFWEKEFPNVRRWPVPPRFGKDPGDAVKAGLDIREWLLSGMPSFVRREAERAERRALCRDSAETAGLSASGDRAGLVQAVPPTFEPTRPSVLLPSWMHQLSEQDLDFFGGVRAPLEDLCGLMRELRVYPVLLSGRGEGQALALWADAAVVLEQGMKWAKVREQFFGPCLEAVLALIDTERLRAVDGRDCHGAPDGDGGEWAVLVTVDGGLAFEGWTRVDCWRPGFRSGARCEEGCRSELQLLPAAG